MPVDDPTSLIGRTLRGKWTVDGLLGTGGMATVYSATHRNGHRVAIKVLHRTHARLDDVRRRFLQEGYAANRVAHPGALTVLDDDELEDGTVFIVMELLEGEPLDSRLRRKKTLSPREVLLIAEPVLDVLAAAHMKGIVHRDIKPANLFLTKDGMVKVLDFGLAKVKEHPFDDKRNTRRGMIIGTAAYMPPEQARGRRELVGPRTDVWAVGATMFKALTGEYVHLGTTTRERLVNAMIHHGRPLSSVAPDIPKPVLDLVDRAIEFQPSLRWPDAVAMRNATRRAYEEITGEPLPRPIFAGDKAGWTIPTATRGPDSIDWSEYSDGTAPPKGDSVLPISVAWEPDSSGTSTLVEFEGDDRTTVLELRRAEDSPPPESGQAEPLSEVMAVERPDTPRKPSTKSFATTMVSAGIKNLKKKK